MILTQLTYAEDSHDLSRSSHFFTRQNTSTSAHISHTHNLPAGVCSSHSQNEGHLQGILLTPPPLSTTIKGPDLPPLCETIHEHSSSRKAAHPMIHRDEHVQLHFQQIWRFSADGGSGNQDHQEIQMGQSPRTGEPLRDRDDGDNTTAHPPRCCSPLLKEYVCRRASSREAPSGVIEDQQSQRNQRRRTSADPNSHLPPSQLTSPGLHYPAANREYCTI